MNRFLFKCLNCEEMLSPDIAISSPSAVDRVVIFENCVLSCGTMVVWGRNDKIRNFRIAFFFFSEVLIEAGIVVFLEKIGLLILNF